MTRDGGADAGTATGDDDGRRERALPVTCAHADVPKAALEALDVSSRALDVASLALARRVFSKELTLLDAIRRKSHAQHRASKHHGMLSDACKRARDLRALGAARAVQALARDANECLRASRVYGCVSLTMPARASADDAMRALYASCVVCDELRAACERVVEAFAGQLGRGYFMPLSLTATACASRVRCECVRMIGEYIKAYNAVGRIRSALPPPGRFQKGAGPPPPAELRVRERADGSACAVPVGDDVVSVDNDLDAAWSGCVMLDDLVGGSSTTSVRATLATTSSAATSADLLDLGVRIDRADVSKNVVTVMKSSQVPQAPMRKYDTVSSRILGGMAPPPNPFGSSKKRRRKKTAEGGDAQAGAGAAPESNKKKSRKQRQSNAPMSAEDAIARLQRLSSF